MTRILESASKTIIIEEHITHRTSPRTRRPVGLPSPSSLRSPPTTSGSQIRQTPCQLSESIPARTHGYTYHPMYLFRVNIAAIGIVLLMVPLKSAGFSLATGAW